MDRAAGMADVNPREAAFFGGGSKLEPPFRGVVVVRAGVDDGIPMALMRKIRVLPGISAEGELQNAHTGKMELFAQRRHFRNDRSEIFRDKGCLGQLF